MNNPLSLTSYDNNFSILSPENMSRYNGRVNIIEPENPNARFQMQERNPIKNKVTEYREALNGELEDTVLSRAFFSAENVQIIQNGLRAGVYAMSKNTIAIPPQDPTSIKLVMRSTFLQFALFQPDNIRGQIERLNKIVLDTLVPDVYGESVAYLKYMQDQSTLVVPLQLPMQPDRVYKQLEQKPWF